MPSCIKRYFLLSIALFSAMFCGYAQPKAIGGTFSLSGLGIMYEHTLNEECFIDMDLRAEMGEVFMNKTDIPGVSASFSCNFIVKKWISRYGTEIKAIVGPGVAIGMARDLGEDFGYFMGLKGRVGLECCFDRKVAVSVCLNPTLGSHLNISGNTAQMKLYKIGMINTVLPEIGIKYMF